MSERILQALMQLFAIGAALERLTLQSRDTVEAFLRQQVSLHRVQESGERASQSGRRQGSGRGAPCCNRR